MNVRQEQTAELNVRRRMRQENNLQIEFLEQILGLKHNEVPVVRDLTK